MRRAAAPPAQRRGMSRPIAARAAAILGPKGRLQALMAWRSPKATEMGGSAALKGDVVPQKERWPRPPEFGRGWAHVAPGHGERSFSMQRFPTNKRPSKVRNWMQGVRRRLSNSAQRQGRRLKRLDLTRSRRRSGRQERSCAHGNTRTQKRGGLQASRRIRRLGRNFAATLYTRRHSARNDETASWERACDYGGANGDPPEPTNLNLGLFGSASIRGAT